MFDNRLTLIGVLLLLSAIVLAPACFADLNSEDAPAGGGAGDLAKQTQNPVSDLISVPFQNNTNFDIGPWERTQNILNIQPVIPFTLNDDWNLITRTILPVVYQPVGQDDDEFGLGDLNFTAFLSPKDSGKVIWGAGPVFLFPTATDDVLGNEKWGVGPSIVVLTMEGPWVYGALWNNIWSFAGDDDRDDVNRMLLQPFVNYNMEGGWYLVSAPVITADWEADSENRWVVPIGGGVGRVFTIGKQPVNVQAQAFYHIVHPDNGPDFSFRFQFQFLFPK